MPDDYTDKDSLRGAIKGDLLEAKRCLTFAIERRTEPPNEDAEKAAKAHVARMSLNREFAFRFPSKDDSLTTEEYEVLVALRRDQHRLLKFVRLLAYEICKVALQTNGVEVPMGKAHTWRRVVAPMLHRQKWTPLRHRLTADGWKKAPDFLMNPELERMRELCGVR